MKSKWIIGIDEAGRGPLAGPVSVGVFVVKVGEKLPILEKVKDSKKCSEKLRKELFEELKICNYAVSFSSALYIDTHGIVPAIKSAMREALGKLEKKLKWNPSECEVYLDGSLRAPDEYVNQQTIIKGDDLIPVISAASICAKVLRDREMVELSKKFPLYKLEIHKGYGTLVHRELIKKNGLSKEHRKSFCKNLLQ